MPARKVEEMADEVWEWRLWEIFVGESVGIIALGESRGGKVGYFAGLVG